MIVISGALVLVALVLLVLGLTMTDLDFVYGSIGVSLVSFVFLVIGILQRRGEPAPADGPAVTDDGTTAPAGDRAPASGTVARTGGGSIALGRARDDEDHDEDDHDEDEDGADLEDGQRDDAPAPVAAAVPGGEPDDDDLEPGGGPVLVVPGRPRYHVEGCRYLAGKQAEELDVLDAQEDGYTACGVCKPDQVLEELYGPLVYEDEDLPAGPSASEPAAAAAERSGSAALGAGPGPDAEQPPAEPAPSTPAADGPAADSPVPAGPPATGTVAVVPGRGRFHVPDCRFVRDMPGVTEIPRDEAEGSGYRPCGVCKP